MTPHPKEDTTFLMVKPDGVKRGLIGEIIKRIEQRGLKIVALEMFLADDKMIDDHYPKDEAWITRLGNKTLTTYKKYGYDPVKELGTDKAEEIGPKVREWLVKYLTSAPMVKMVVQGIHAIDMVRKIAGDTQPINAEMGTIRGDFSADSAASANRDKRAIHNLIHASETPDEAVHEIAQWFTKDQIHSYKRVEEDLMI
jgi:nucleoside-diphosphate kinase